MDKPLIYVAGKLNSDSAPNYIQNLNRMIVYAEEVRKMGAAVFVPGNDLIHGAITGNHEYNDYFDNSISILLKCDAIALTPNWKGSKGVEKEIEIAKENGILVLGCLDAVEMFIKMYDADEIIKVKERCKNGVCNTI